MTGEESQELGSLTELVIALGILLIIAGVFWRGVTLQGLHRIWHDVINRPSGPISFRFIPQPSLAVTARIILFGLAMHLIDQALVFKTLYPVEALIIALPLALAPYWLIHGPAAPGNESR